MRLLLAVAALFALFSTAQAQNTSLDLFPSKSIPVALTSTDGKTLHSVILDVWPERQSVRIFVEDLRDTFILPLDTFDEPSQESIQDWFFKRAANEQLRIKTEEVQLPGLSITDPKALPSPPVSGFGTGTRSTSLNTRARQINATISSNADHEFKNLSVEIGTRVVRSISNHISNSEQESFSRTISPLPVLGPRKDWMLKTNPIPLSNYTERYTIKVPVFRPGYTGEVEERHRLTATDRIQSHYVLVYYKGELVNAYVSHRPLIDKILEEQKRAKNIPPHRTQFPLPEGQIRTR